jgi:hypothetical protein
MSVRTNNQYAYARNKYSVEKNTVKKFCGVCQKAGLSEKEYTSHFTKSTPGPQGIVICPTILNNECTFCFEFGHFKSACPAIAARERADKKRAAEEKRDQYKQAVVAESKKKSKSVTTQNRYSGLFDECDSDSENDSKTVKPVAVQSTGPKPVDVKPMDTTKPSFAAMLAREAPKTPELPINTTLTVLGSVMMPPVYKCTPAVKSATTPYKRRSWVDFSDSEDEEEEELEETRYADSW